MGKADKGWALRSPSVTNLEKRDSRLKGQSAPLVWRLGSFELGVYWIAVSHAIWLEPGRRGGKSQEVHSGR